MATSPCVRNCCLDQDDCCLGCGRLMNEILEWHTADKQRRSQILELASNRLIAIEKKDIFKHPELNPFE